MPPSRPRCGIPQSWELVVQSSLHCVKVSPKTAGNWGIVITGGPALAPRVWGTQAAQWDWYSGDTGAEENTARIIHRVSKNLLVHKTHLTQYIAFGVILNWCHKQDYKTTPRTATFVLIPDLLQVPSGFIRKFQTPLPFWRNRILTIALWKSTFSQRHVRWHTWRAQERSSIPGRKHHVWSAAAAWRTQLTSDGSLLRQQICCCYHSPEQDV